MKSVIISAFIFGMLTGLVVADGITLSLTQIEGLKYSCSLTNANKYQVYIAPFYLEEKFYKHPDCLDCATNWVGSRPMAINAAKDFIPLAPGAVLNFNAIGEPDPHLPWRISCFGLTNVVHAAADDRIVIHSPEIAPKI